MIQFSTINPNTSFAELFELEQKEFTLHQHIDFLDYQKQRLAFLEKHLTSPNSQALYDFSSAANMAMGDNQGMVEPGIWALYTGDINQDDYIDGNDFPQYDSESASGGLFDGTYTSTDINGDGFVDGNDFPVYDFNSSNAVSAVHP